MCGGYLCTVGSGDEFLQFGKLVDLGQGIDQLRFDLRLLDTLAAHVQEFDQVVPESLTFGSDDDIDVVGRIVCLDVRICRPQKRKKLVNLFFWNKKMKRGGHGYRWPL